MSNFAVKLVLGRTHYAKQYDIHDYLCDYSARGGWSIVRDPKEQDWCMDIMFGYTTILFNEYTAFRKFLIWFDIKDDYKYFELNAAGEYVKIIEVGDI